MPIRIIGPNIGPKPKWAKALIVAEYETDESEIQTDYFATKTQTVVPLAWSKHTKDLFREMRKAAAKFKPTKDLGPGCDVWTARVVFATTEPIYHNGNAYFPGQPSPWHSELDGGTWDGPSFGTKAEVEAYVASKPQPGPVTVGETPAVFKWKVACQSIEHREKYSMGHGYYLKGSGRYSSGWVVRKSTYRPEFDKVS